MDYKNSVSFSDKEKIEAFDKIAGKFYNTNFGTTSKSEIEVLMFSILIEKFLKENEKAPDTYSDYSLSKILGITQEKINKLKVQKQLKYPLEAFNWKESFISCLSNAYIEKNKIKVFIDDPNIAIEVKHAIEENGGFTDSSFNAKICIISPGDFLDLICVLYDKKKIKEVKTIISDNLNKNQEGLEILGTEPFGKQLKQAGIDLSCEIIIDILDKVPVLGSVLKPVFETAVSLGQQKNKSKKIKQYIEK
ncbi:MAG: hypothetical protein MJ181_07590 [Treponema sp.]|nr:hypothetical protein [Treponema sp.]